MSNLNIKPAGDEVPEVFIVIGGKKKVGKSTLALFIAMCLEKVGIENISITGEDNPEIAQDENLAARLDAIKAAGTNVKIDLRDERPRIMLPPGVA